MIYKSFDEKLDALVWPVFIEGEKEANIEARRAYHDAQDEIHVAFRYALAVEYGLTDHPKELRVWDLSWRDGHSSGYYEVENWYQELAELVK